MNNPPPLRCVACPLDAKQWVGAAGLCDRCYELVDAIAANPVAVLMRLGPDRTARVALGRNR